MKDSASIKQKKHFFYAKLHPLNLKVTYDVF